MFPMTPWVKRLLIANVVAFIVTTMVLPGLYFAFALIPVAVVVRPWTAVTYMFLHANLGHLLFNMIGLFFFGPRLEQYLGSKDFLWLYFLGGIGGAVLSFFFAPGAPIVGASAAVYAVILGFALLWPREVIYIWGVLPLQAWVLAAIMVGGSLWSGISGAQDGVAHFAHLGGLVFGFAWIKGRDWWRGRARRDFRKKVEDRPSRSQSDRTALKRWKAIDTASMHELNREEVEGLLRKADDDGVKALSSEERAFLDRMAGWH